MGKQSTNITWHAGQISDDERAALLGHRSATLWLTGLSGSGKSTLARALEKKLVTLGINAYVLDGDNVRHGLNGDLDFSPAARTENIRRVGEVARLFVDSGTLVITAFISPYRADRERVRQLHAAGQFIEVFLDCDLDACEARDPKGLYKLARAGKINDFTGISAPYEAPESPEIVVHTSRQAVDMCVELVIADLRSRNLIS